MKKWIFVLIVLSGIAWAQRPDRSPLPSDISWQLKGLSGITVRCLASAKNTIYAATAGKGIFISTDNGDTWRASNTGIADSFVYSITGKDDHIFAGTRNGVYISSNNGSSWSPRRNGMPNGTKTYTLMASSNSLFAGSANGVYKSIDNGNSWTLYSSGFTGSPYIYALAEQDSTLFAGTQENGIMKSKDGGITWSSANLGIPSSTTIGSLYVINNNTLLAGADGGSGIYLSLNKGESWSVSNKGLYENRIFSFAQNNFAIYAGTQKAVYKSSDNAVSWIQLTTKGISPAAYINDVIVMGNKIIISTDEGIYSLQEQ